MLNMCKRYILSFYIFKQTITSLLKVANGICYYNATHHHLLFFNYVEKIMYINSSLIVRKFTLFLFLLDFIFSITSLSKFLPIIIYFPCKSFTNQSIFLPCNRYMYLN